MTKHDKRNPKGVRIGGKRVPEMPASVCREEGCGRPAHVRGLCQTHYKHLRLYGVTRPIKPRRAPRSEAVVKLGGVYLTPDAAQTIEEIAELRKLTRNALMTDILEEWAKRKHENRDR